MNREMMKRQFGIEVNSKIMMYKWKVIHRFFFDCHYIRTAKHNLSYFLEQSLIEGYQTFFGIREEENPNQDINQYILEIGTLYTHGICFYRLI